MHKDVFQLDWGCRLMRPTEDYLPYFQPTLLRARLAANTAATLACVPDSPLTEALPALLAGEHVVDDYLTPEASRMTRRQAAKYEEVGLRASWQPECDPYRGLGYWDMDGQVDEEGVGGLQAEDADGHQAFLCHQAATLLGRHAPKVSPPPPPPPPPSLLITGQGLTQCDAAYMDTVGPFHNILACQDPRAMTASLLELSAYT